MIKSISANSPSFHEVSFSPGLNVILAERMDESTPKDTRNGLGKSTLVEIMNFCLGASTSKGKGLCIDPLSDLVFEMVLSIAGNTVKVSRAISSPNRILIEGPTNGWIYQPEIDKISKQKIISLIKWKELLGWAFFGLAESKRKYHPSYRSLISYFARHSLGSYNEPFKHYAVQNTWDVQISIGFLIGLNWEYAAQWQDLRDREKSMKEIKKAFRSEIMQKTWGSIGEMRAERVRLEKQEKIEREAIDSFRVHPQYESIQSEANQLTSRIHDRVNQNVIDERKLNLYQDSISAEKAPSDTEVKKVYEELGVHFPASAMKNLSEARSFHRQIIENRKEFLQNEVIRLERDISVRKEEIRDLTNERANKLQILQTHGALQEMHRMQERYADTKGKLNHVINRIDDMKQIESGHRDIKSAKVDLVRVAELDYEQRRNAWGDALRIFDDNSKALYENPGRLIIDIGEAGYKYQVEIDRSGSSGIEKMKVFCFDLMLLQLALRRNLGVDFLIHDSTLYDGVDSRQRALALEHAAKVSEENGGQYICMLNSDMVPREEFSPDFDFDQYVRLTLTDKEEAGSLLGFRFERLGK